MLPASPREGILESYGCRPAPCVGGRTAGRRFGLVTFSDRTQRIVRSAQRLDHFRLCRETIYNLRAQRVSPDFRDVFTQPSTEPAPPLAAGLLHLARRCAAG